MSEYQTAMGRIRHRKDTGLRAVNQRKIAKAIRRGVGMGLMPSVHRHPEILEVEAKRRNDKQWYKDEEERAKRKKEAANKERFDFDNRPYSRMSR